MFYFVVAGIIEAILSFISSEVNSQEYCESWHSVPIYANLPFSCVLVSDQSSTLTPLVQSRVLYRFWDGKSQSSHHTKIGWWGPVKRGGRSLIAPLWPVVGSYVFEFINIKWIALSWVTTCAVRSERERLKIQQWDRQTDKQTDWLTDWLRKK